MKLSRRQLLVTGSLFAVAAPFSARRAWGAEASTSEIGFEELTDKSERAARRGVEWMQKTMHRDGGCGVDIGQPADIGCTAMVGLSLLSQGNTPVEGPFSGEIRRITSYLLRAIENMPSEDITSELHTQLQNKIGRHAHSFFAALFLAQVLGEGNDPEYVRPKLKKLVQTIVDAQTSEGDWQGQSWAPMLGTVMGWVSLRAADFAGIKVGSSPQKVADHIVKQMNIGQDSGSWMHTLYKNATGIRVLYSMGREDEEIAKKAFEAVNGLIGRDNTAFSQAGGEEYLAFHLITETMLQKGGTDWKTWFPVVRDKIISVQNGDGSWTGHHCITSRTFCTAAACLVLTSPYRYLPISQP